MAKGRKLLYAAVCAVVAWSVFGLSLRAPLLAPSWHVPGHRPDTVRIAASDLPPDSIALDSLAPDSASGEPEFVELLNDRLYVRGDFERQTRVADSVIQYITGNVVFYHNGVVISCDSAVSYDRKRLVGFRNVTVNRRDTYIYGDRIEYDTETKLARVFSPIVKTVDKESVLYTYNMTYNTEENVGYYTGGGTMYQDSNRMESERGYFYSDSSRIVALGGVQLRSPDYDLVSDSVRYELDAETAHFTTRSYVWSKDGDFLTATRGNYDSGKGVYTFVDSSYVMTAGQEIWADTMYYEGEAQNAELTGNVQVTDTANRVMAFGDYARYWGETQNALLTRNPSLLSYEDADTVYIRSDSMFLYSIRRETPADSAAVAGADSLAGVAGLPGLDPEADSTSLIIGPVSGDSTGAVTLTARELRRLEKQEAREARRLEKEELRRLKRQAREERKAERLALKESILSGEYLEGHEGHDHGGPGGELDPDHDHGDGPDQDDNAESDIAAGDSTAAAGIPVLTGLPGEEPAAGNEQDSMLRIFRGYYNVKIYRSDFQAVCDSVVGFSVDSSMHMYVEPVMWNENSQIQSEYVDIYTKDEVIERAEFFGQPIMSQELDTAHYNQIKGREMTAYFTDGSINLLDVTGNAQTYYYFEETDSLGSYVNGFSDITSANMAFHFREGELNDITWTTGVENQTFPMHMIPADQPQRLPGFEWLGIRRPQRQDVFDREVRPSQRLRYGGLEKPVFPITGGIDGLKATLTRSGGWADRTNPLSPIAVEYVDGLLRDAGLK